MMPSSLLRPQRRVTRFCTRAVMTARPKNTATQRRLRALRPTMASGAARTKLDQFVKLTQKLHAGN